MSALITAPNLGNSDDFYARLLATHEGLSEAETARLNARLILILANHIGDLDVLFEALEVARSPGFTAPEDATKA
ncbi:MAG: DUF2783 domain-containing protein [Pseudomonadota bacterium]